MERLTFVSPDRRNRRSETAGGGPCTLLRGCDIAGQVDGHRMTKEGRRVHWWHASSIHDRCECVTYGVEVDLPDASVTAQQSEAVRVPGWTDGPSEPVHDHQTCVGVARA